MENNEILDKREKGRLVDKYPIEALKGKQLQFNEEWKKAFVAFRCITMVHAKTYKNIIVLSEQISDTFNTNFDKGQQMELNENNLKNLRLMFRIQNLFISLASYINKVIPPIDVRILASKDNMDMDLFKYYIASKAQLEEVSKEYQNLANAITNSQNDCFKEKLEETNRVKVETLNLIHTTEDLDSVTNKFMNALDINM